MIKRLFHCMLAVLLGLILTVLLLWFDVTIPARANPDTRYVAPPPLGLDASNDCTNPTAPCATIQHAIDMAVPGDDIRIAGSTYTSTAGTVAVVTKSVILEGGYPADFSGHDPGLYHTVLDAQGGGSVISITNAGAVALQFLTLTHGDGTGNYCGGNGCGGGIYAFNTFLHVGDCVITNNIASKSGSMRLGGGIYAKGDHNVYVWNNQIISNTANIDSLSTIYSYGGGIFIHSAPVLLKEDLILNNVGSRAGTGGVGGGIFLYHVAQADVLTNTIQGNKASISSGTGTGGGVPATWFIRQGI